MKTITLTAPKGFEFTGAFRYPKAGEWFADGNLQAPRLRGTEDFFGERFILRSIKPRRFVFEEVPNEDISKTKGFYQGGVLYLRFIEEVSQ